eukprot:412125_1
MDLDGILNSCLNEINEFDETALQFQQLNENITNVILNKCLDDFAQEHRMNITFQSHEYDLLNAQMIDDVLDEIEDKEIEIQKQKLQEQNTSEKAEERIDEVFRMIEATTTFPLCNECPKDVSELAQFMQHYSADSNVNIDAQDAARYLNAFLHLIQSHNADEQFELIMAQCGSCDIKTCSIFKRHYRDKRSADSQSLLYQLHSGTTVTTPTDICSLQIMDTIHCFYKHCDDLGMRTRIQNEEQDEHEENDVVNESIKKRNQMVSTKRKMHETYVGSSKKFSKFNQLSVDPEFKDDSRDTNKNAKMYCFGSEFVYDYEDEHIFHHDNYTPIKPTYNSFKDELIQNEIATLSKHQFQIQHKKANLHFNTPYCKSNFGDIKVEHLLALMFYCNYDTLQAQFSLTYRQSIPKTNQFYHWGRLLKEAVHKYGTTIQDG